MLNPGLLSFITLYNKHKVYLTIDGGKSAVGILNEINQQHNELTVDGSVYSFDSVVDIEYIGRLTDFRTFHREGTIDNVYNFYLDGGADSKIDERMLYKEFDCTVACHLKIEDMQIMASDVRLFSYIHVINDEILSTDAFLYILDDNTYHSGILSRADGENWVLQKNGQDVFVLNIENIRNITRLPKINDILTIVLADGSKKSGLVSAVLDNSISIYDSTSAEIIDFSNVSQFRYHGEITAINSGKIYIDEKYMCKIPYYLNKASVGEDAFEGMKVSYVVGIVMGNNGRGLIAKDVIFDVSSTSKNIAKEKELGIIITVDVTKSDGIGYIGKRYVCKAYGTPSRGDVRFSREKLGFPINFDMINVVSYTISRKINDTLKEAGEIELVEQYEYKKYSLVTIDEENHIIALPIFQALPSLYDLHDVDIICKNNMICSGIIQSHDEISILLKKENDGVQDECQIKYADIEDIRVYGTVTQYQLSGIGWVDNTFFFHINDMISQSQAKYIHKGSAVSFALGNSRRGNGTTCIDIEAVMEEKREVYVLDFKDDRYLVTDAKKYNNGRYQHQDTYYIPYGRQNIFRYLKAEDYLAVFTLQRRNGRTECVYITTRQSLPKKIKGVIIAIDDRENKCKVISSEEYGTPNQGNIFVFQERDDIAKFQNISMYDYQVVFQCSRRDNEEVIKIISVGSRYPKMRFGYIQKYVPSKNFGFITPDEYYGMPYSQLEKSRVCHFFLGNWIKSIDQSVGISDATLMNTVKSDYRVKYNLGIQQSSGELPRTYNIHIIAELPKQRTTVTTKSATVTVEREENISLSDTFPINNNEQRDIKYGILPLYNENFNSCRCYLGFSNKKFYEGNTKRYPQTDIDLTKIEVVSPYAIDTKKNIFLVRYTVMDDAISYEHPLEVLCHYSKTNVKQIEIDGDILRLTYIELPAKNQSNARILKEEEKYFPDETIVLKNDQDIYSPSEVFSYEDGEITPQSGDQIDVMRTDIYRFGVFTGSDEDFTVGYLNGYLKFKTSKLEKRAFDIVKANRHKQLLMCFMHNGEISSIECVSDAIMSSLSWHEGRVEHWDEEEKKMIISSSASNEKFTYYRTVDTADLYIDSLINNNCIVGSEVYYKPVCCPFYDDSNKAYDKCYVIAVLHSQQELTAIRYDAIHDTYTTNKGIPVIGAPQHLKDRLNQQTLVSFYRTESDYTKLFACLPDEPPSDVSETLEAQNNTNEIEREKIVPLYETVLGKLCLEREDIKASYAGLNNKDELFDFYVSYSDRNIKRYTSFLAAASMVNSLPDEWQTELSQKQDKNVSSLLDALLRKAFLLRSTDIIYNNSGTFAEYSYYVTALINGTFRNDKREEMIYRLLLPDFLPEVSVQADLNRLDRYQRKGGPLHGKTISLKNLFNKNPQMINNLAIHLLPLNEISFQMAVNAGLLDGNPQREQAFIKWGKSIDEEQSFEVTKLMEHIRKWLYQPDKKRFMIAFAKASENTSPIISAVKEMENVIGAKSRFIKFMLQEDVERFKLFDRGCQNIRALKEKSFLGFKKYEEVLLENYHLIYKLYKDIQNHPTIESAEMLLNTGIISATVDEAVQMLQILYTKTEYYPELIVTADNPTLVPGEEEILLSIRNREKGETNYQSADDIKLVIEPIRGLSKGAVSSTYDLSEKNLLAGQDAPAQMSIHFDKNGLNGNSFEINVRIIYYYKIGFNGLPLKCEKSINQSFIFDIANIDDVIKDPTAKNFYARSAIGEPLSASEDDKKMFFGREHEMKDIWDYIVDQNTQVMNAGKAIILYGQKKCGKTSLINQVMKKITTSPETKDQAIVLWFPNINISDFEHFNMNFYSMILGEFGIQLMDRPDIVDIMEKNNLDFPDINNITPAMESLFPNFFKRLFAYDRNLRVVLIMDEFTLLCKEITMYSEIHPEYKRIPTFIKTLSGLGFVQIIIGHDNMIKMLSKLGVINHTAEFAKKIELNGLNNADAERMIRDPMKWSFGKEVFTGNTGSAAVERLIELSGKSPRLLASLCNEMFVYYLTKSKRPNIPLADVNKMVEEYINDASKLNDSTFDMLLIEDGDKEETLNLLPTYLYLKQVAQISYSSENHDCDENVVCKEIGVDNSLEIRNTLLDRQVIRRANGRIHINAYLFVEYIHSRYGNSSSEGN